MDSQECQGLKVTQVFQEFLDSKEILD